MIYNAPYSGLVVHGERFPQIYNDPAAIRAHEIGEALAKGAGQWDPMLRFLHARDNVIENNEIFSVMQVLGDGNCIYLTGTGAGNIIRANYLHDIWSQGWNNAIRLDGWQKDTTVADNIMYRLGGGGISVVDRNVIENNITADLRLKAPDGRAIFFFSYTMVGGYFTFADLDPPFTMRNNITYSREEASLIQPYFEGKMEHNRIDRNLYYTEYNPKVAQSRLKELQVLGLEKNGMAADPMFVNLDKQDFRLKPGSPALKMGFHQLDVNKMGLEPPYRKKFVGKVISTTITRPAGLLMKEMEVAMASSENGAKIRYTLDGSAPLKDSALYTGPLLIKEPCRIRSASFKDGCSDLMGADTYLNRPPSAIHQDFEAIAVGERVLEAQNNDEGGEAVIRVSDEIAASGKHSLKFIDRASQKWSFNPHLVYSDVRDEGILDGEFDLRVDKTTNFLYQWRENETLLMGPTVRVREGALIVDEKDLMPIPMGEWVHFKVKCGLGSKATGKFDLEVCVPGAEPKVFHDLACSPKFKKMNWFGLLADGTKDAVFYVDNVTLKNIDEQ